ncbi:PA28-beta domain-containing protein [Mycena chlorophos]|uniref:PA28-beta domain-containing protein n=1 Tax=Mycena chlorophos TaxID=658473 RepID=A0A8H6T662_MYCCL|nr:PA28-beta domain-containing protein [Mycena chlorophos]
MVMEKALAAKLEAFHKNATEVGEQVVFKDFPAKVRDGSTTACPLSVPIPARKLHELVESTNDPSSPYHASHLTTLTDPTVYPPPHAQTTNGESGKKRKLSIDESISVASDLGDVGKQAQYLNLVRANAHIPQLHEILKRECEDLITLTDKIKLWISLTMPKIEGSDSLSRKRSPLTRPRGDNFGVQIQEEVVNELARAQDSAMNLRDMGRTNHLSRAKIASKLIKYPNVEDYALALKEHDNTQFYMARQNLIDLLSIYAVLTDLIHKNIARIRAPKSGGGIGLY